MLRKSNLPTLFTHATLSWRFPEEPLLREATPAHLNSGGAGIRRRGDAFAVCAQTLAGNGGTAASFTVKYRGMCGICGVLGIERSELGEALTRRMMEALWHRGPDEDGLLVAPSAALGMRRLSIIDLPGGHQPVFNETGNVGVVFNGEIYNFRQLRKTLEATRARLPHAFRHRSNRPRL